MSALQRTAVVVLAGVLAALSGCTPAERAEPALIVTGPQGGVYHALGAAFEEVSAGWQVPLSAQASGASVVNLEQVGSGSADLGFALSDIAALAVAGEPPFESPQPITAVAKLYDNHTHLIVTADSEIQQLEDLHGIVALGPDGSGTELMSERLLETAGLTDGSGTPEPEGASGSSAHVVETVTMDLLASTDALVSGEIDALF